MNWVALVGMVAFVMQAASANATLTSPPRAPRLGPQDQVLGTYQIADITLDSRTYDGSLCDSAQLTAAGRSPRPSVSCGKYVWLVRQGQQLAVLRGDDSEGLARRGLRSFLDRPALPRQACDTHVTLEQAAQGLFSTRLCRGTQAMESSRAGKDVFAVVDHADPQAESVANALVVGAATGVMLGYSSIQRVELPSSESVPRELELIETLHGTMFFVQATLHKHYRLVRVAD